MANQAQVDTFVAMMKEVARYAEKHGVVVGLEDWISAEDNIRLLDAIGSDYVAVYYDAHNIVARAARRTSTPSRRLLGKRINQIHVKNANMLLSTPGGKLDWPRMAQEFYDDRLPRLVRPRDRLADEGHRRRHARQYRVREEDVPHASAPGDITHRTEPLANFKQENGRTGGKRSGLGFSVIGRPSGAHSRGLPVPTTT